MLAAGGRFAGAGPRFADFADPVVGDGEILVQVTAAGLHSIVRMLASGGHYGSQGTLPMIPGIDGTGRLPDGRAVYFGGVRPPYGPMAQRAAAGFVLPLPEGLAEAAGPDGIHVIVDYLWARRPRRPSRPSPAVAWRMPRPGSGCGGRADGRPHHRLAR